MKKSENYYIGAYWLRREPIEDISNKVIRYLTDLRNIDNLFSKWFELGMSRKAALEKEIENIDPSIQKLLLASLEKGELQENGFAKNGFRLSGWSGHDDNESFSFSIFAGDDFENAPCNCILNLPNEGVNRESLLQKNKLEAIMQSIIDIWNPEFAVFSSNKLRSELGSGNRLGWISYNREHGMHSIDTGNEYDSDNESHLESIRAVKSLYVSTAN